eukprot:9095109-Pyramimonas_sp.AAC.1
MCWMRWRMASMARWRNGGGNEVEDGSGEAWGRDEVEEEAGMDGGWDAEEDAEDEVEDGSEE